MVGAILQGIHTENKKPFMARFRTPVAAGKVAVEMLTTYASPSGVCRAGKVIELEAKEAEELIKEGFAKAAGKPAKPVVSEESEDEE